MNHNDEVIGGLTGGLFTLLNGFNYFHFQQTMIGHLISALITAILISWATKLFNHYIGKFLYKRFLNFKNKLWSKNQNSTRETNSPEQENKIQ